MTSYLTETQVQQFHQDGYLIVSNLFDSETATRLKQRSIEIIRTQLDLNTHPKIKFKTTEHNGSENMVADYGNNSLLTEKNKNNYFLSTADTIGFFFEENAFESEDNSTPRFEITRCINKIGHALHVLDREFQKFSFSENIQQIACDIGFVAPIILQSMVICKQPIIGGKVDTHRDSTFLYTEPSSCVGLWFALENCTEENGCLSFVPGSHRTNSTRRMKREEPHRKTINNETLNPTLAQIESIQTTPINEGVQLPFTGSDLHNYKDSEFISTPVPVGSVVIIHGDVVHRSKPNFSEHSRFIYTFHLIESYSTTYPTDNWLQSSKPFKHLLNESREKSNINNKQITNK